MSVRWGISPLPPPLPQAGRPPGSEGGWEASERPTYWYSWGCFCEFLRPLLTQRPAAPQCRGRTPAAPRGFPSVGISLPPQTVLSGEDFQMVPGAGIWLMRRKAYPLLCQTRSGLRQLGSPPAVASPSDPQARVRAIPSACRGLRPSSPNGS